MKITLEELRTIRSKADEEAETSLNGNRWSRAYAALADAADVLIGLEERKSQTSTTKLTPFSVSKVEAKVFGGEFKA